MAPALSFIREALPVRTFSGMKQISCCELPSAYALWHLPLPSARCTVWVGVWPAAPCLLLSECGKVHELAFALSTQAAETPELLCRELAEWPEDEHGEIIQQELLNLSPEDVSEETLLQLSTWPCAWTKEN